MTSNAAIGTNNLEAFWMPFTANRQFKKAPRMFVSADRMHYTTSEGRKVLDATAGLWCVNAGHARPKIRSANKRADAGPVTTPLRKWPTLRYRPLRWGC